MRWTRKPSRKKPESADEVAAAAAGWIGSIAVAESAAENCCCTSNWTGSD